MNEWQKRSIAERDFPSVSLDLSPATIRLVINRDAR